MKPKSGVWKFFLEKTCNNKTVYECKYCGKTYTNKNATKFSRHIKRCTKCPVLLKKSLLDKSSRSTLSGKPAPVWVPQVVSNTVFIVSLEQGHGPSESEILDLDMEEIPEEGNANSSTAGLLNVNVHDDNDCDSISTRSTTTITTPKSSRPMSMSVSRLSSFVDTMNIREQVFMFLSTGWPVYLGKLGHYLISENISDMAKS